MSRTGWWTAAGLGSVVVLIVAALFAEAASEPTFRAGDHASYQECMQNIPAEWQPGSMERSGSEDACYYVHVRSRAR